MNIEFKMSAFRHRISEADIRLGFDTSGNLLEILYNEYDDRVCIFHAMRCRSIFFDLLEV